MPNDIDHEEEKVQRAIQILSENPGMKIAKAARITRAPYDRLRGRLAGKLPSTSRGGHNKKLSTVEDDALKDYLYLLVAHQLGRPPNLTNIKASANSILRARCGWGQEPETVSRKWTKRWIVRQQKFIKHLRGKPLSSLRRQAQLKSTTETHFTDFKKCKERWGIHDDDVYNFDEVGT